MNRHIVDMKVTPGRRIIAISDIHAHLEVFQRLLKKVNFSDDDLLVIVGDVIEGGPQSLASLRTAMELAPRDNVVVLAGNWEAFVHALMVSDDGMKALKGRSLGVMEDSGTCLLYEMCREIGLTFDKNTDMAAIMPRIREHFAAEIQFMGRLPACLDTGEFFFVHGGAPTLDHETLRRLDDYAVLKNDEFALQDVHFSRYQVVGHWPVNNYGRALIATPHVDRERKIVSIDGGMGKARCGQLNALLLRAGEPETFHWEYEDDFPKARALEGQAGSVDPLNIIWSQRQVERISSKGGVSTVRHIASGRVVELPDSFIFEYEGELCSGSATDYRLNVEPGDVLSLMAETPMGLYCKKDGVVGWYSGEYERLV